MILKNYFSLNIYLQKIIIAIAIFFCIDKLFFPKTGFSETVISYIAYPAILIQGKIANLKNNYHQRKKDLGDYKKQLFELQAEKDELLRENMQLKSAIGYLEKVQELIEFKKRYEPNFYLTCQIVSKNFSNQSHYFIIDKGTNSGIERDMIAVYKNCLVGRVAQVYPNYSKIITITDKSCKVSAFCYRTNAIGIYQGQNKLDSAQLNYVNHLENLQEDDLVLSSGEGLIFPQGFALGKISKFNKNDVQYDVTIKPLIDINSLNYCQIIKK